MIPFIQPPGPPRRMRCSSAVITGGRVVQGDRTKPGGPGAPHARASCPLPRGCEVDAVGSRGVRPPARVYSGSGSWAAGSHWATPASEAATAGPFRSFPVTRGRGPRFFSSLPPSRAPGPHGVCLSDGNGGPRARTGLYGYPPQSRRQNIQRLRKSFC